MLGNFAGEGAPSRDAVLSHGALQPLVACLLARSGSGRSGVGGYGCSLSLLRIGSWALSNLCDGQPRPVWGLRRETNTNIRGREREAKAVRLKVSGECSALDDIVLGGMSENKAKTAYVLQMTTWCAVPILSVPLGHLLSLSIPRRWWTFTPCFLYSRRCFNPRTPKS